MSLIQVIIQNAVIMNTCIECNELQIKNKNE